MLTLPGGGVGGRTWTDARDRMGAHEGQLVSESRTQMGALVVCLSRLISSGSTPAVLIRMGVVRLWHCI